MIKINQVTNPETREKLDLICRRNGSSLQKVEAEAQALASWIDRERENWRKKRNEISP